MLSPARRHFIRATAGVAASNIPEGKQQTGDQFELMSAALWEARRTLKDIKSIDKKIQKKAELLPQFMPYVLGVLGSGKGAQDDVFMTIMIWLLDVGNLKVALELAEYAIKHNLKAPDQYRRDTASLITEQLADAALQIMAAAAEAEQTAVAQDLLDYLVRVETLTREADMHDQIRAKLFKALGYAYRDIPGNSTAALACLQRAMQLNDRAGVKKDIERLEREVKKQSEAASNSAGSGDAGEKTPDTAAGTEQDQGTGSDGATEQEQKNEGQGET